MMKKIFLLTVLAAVMTACGGCSTKQSKTSGETTTQSENALTAMTLDEVMMNAESNVDKQVRIEGFVTHTCKHSGKRCFLTGETKKYTIRVEAKGKIGGFNRELIGSKIDLKGTLKERRLTPTEIAEMEAAISAKEIADNGSVKSCDTETANIKMMREWMKEHGKDYYAIYYIDGQEYEIVE